MATLPQVDWNTQIKNRPAVAVPAVPFPAQTPGGSLIIGSNTVTLRPVPLGINGTNTNHYVYLSGGTGTAEAVRITGGTAVSGANSGTITFTAAHTHSGAWTVASATAGISEAYWSNGGTGHIRIEVAEGDLAVYAPVKITASNVAIVGAGLGATTLTNSTLNSEIFQIASCSDITIDGLLLVGNASSTLNYAIDAASVSYLTLRNLFILTWPNGILLDTIIQGMVQNVYVRDINGGDGFMIKGNTTNALLLDGVQTISSLAHNSGLHIIASGNAVIANSEFIGNFGGATQADIWINPTGGDNVFSTDIVNTYADQGNKGLWINPGTGSQVLRTRCTHFWASSTSGQAGIHLDSAGGGAIHGFLCTASEVSGNATNGLQVDTGDSIGISNSTFSNDGGTGIALNAGQFISITGNRIGNGFSGFGGGATEVFGVYHPGVATNVTITGNIFNALSTTPINLATTATALVIAGNQGIDDIAPVAVASGTTVTISNATQTYSVTGTTTVTTISGANWTGRTLRLIKTDAGSVTIGGGGNIPLAHTLAQNGSLTLYWNGSAWL